MTGDRRQEVTEDVAEPDETGSDSDTDVRLAARFDRGLERARTEPRVHGPAVAGAIVVGLVISWFHWLGLVLGGALVGLVSPTVRRALVGGLGFGVVVLIAFAVTLGESAVVVAGTTPVVYVAVVAAIGLPLLGSLVRIVR